MQEEIHFADQKVQQSTDKIYFWWENLHLLKTVWFTSWTNFQVVYLSYFSHNDLHQGNVMADFNENEEILADTLQE